MARQDEPPERGRTLRRVGWMVLIWVASTAALGLVALAMRFLMRLVGMSR